jgi:hypothetical protein
MDREDQGLHGEPRAPSVTSIDDAYGETDFSGVSDPAIEGPLVPRRDELDDELADHAFGGGEDDGVFTSASRPGSPAPEDSLYDDDLAPPPAPEPRRSPAIVRRPRPSSPGREVQPGDSDSMFSEETRVADFTEIERQAFSSRQAEPSAAARRSCGGPRCRPRPRSTAWTR